MQSTTQTAAPDVSVHFVLGGVGSGKTRLIRTLSERLHAMAHHEVCVVVQGYAATDLSGLDSEEVKESANSEDYGTRLLLNAWAPRNDGRLLFPADATTIRSVLPARFVLKSAADATRMVSNRLAMWYRGANSDTSRQCSHHLFVECLGESLELMTSVLAALQAQQRIVSVTATICTRCELCEEDRRNNNVDQRINGNIDTHSAVSLARSLASRGCPSTVVSLRGCDDTVSQPIPSNEPPSYQQCCAVHHMVVAPRQPLDVAAWLAHHHVAAPPRETVLSAVASIVNAVQTETTRAMALTPALVVMELTCTLPLRMYAVSTWLNRLPVLGTAAAAAQKQQPCAAILRIKGVLWAPNCRARVFLLDACGGSGQGPLKPHSAPVLHPGNSTDCRVSRVVLVVNPTDVSTTAMDLIEYKRALQLQFNACAIASCDANGGTALRFRAGDVVEAHVDGWSTAVVLQTWDEGNAYRLRVVQTGDEIWAPADDDSFVRTVVPSASDDAGMPPQVVQPPRMPPRSGEDDLKGIHMCGWAVARHGAREDVEWLVEPLASTCPPTTPRDSDVWSALAATEGPCCCAVDRLTELLQAMPLALLRQLVAQVVATAPQKKSPLPSMRAQTCASTDACIALIVSRVLQCGSDYGREAVSAAGAATLMPLFMSVVRSVDEGHASLLSPTIVQLFVDGCGASEQCRAARSALGELCVALEIPLHVLLRPHGNQVPSSSVAKALLRLVVDGIVLRGLRQALHGAPLALLRNVATHIPALTSGSSAHCASSSLAPSDHHACGGSPPSASAPPPSAACATCAAEVWRAITDCLVPLGVLQQQTWRSAACQFRVMPCPIVFTMHPSITATATTTTTATGCVRIDVRNASLMYYDRRGVYYAPPFEFSGCRWQLLLCNDDRPANDAERRSGSTDDELAAYLCVDRDVRCTFRIDLLHQCRDENIRVRSHHRFADNTRFTKGWGSGVAPFVHILAPHRGFVSGDSRTHEEPSDVISFEVLISMGDDNRLHDGERDGARARTCTTEVLNHQLLQAIDAEDRDAKRLALIAKLLRSEESGRKDVRHQQRSVFEAMLRASAQHPPPMMAPRMSHASDDATSLEAEAATRLRLHDDIQLQMEVLRRLELELMEADAELDAVRSVKKSIVKRLAQADAAVGHQRTRVAHQNDAIQALSAALQTVRSKAEEEDVDTDDVDRDDSDDDTHEVNGVSSLLCEVGQDLPVPKHSGDAAGMQLPSLWLHSPPCGRHLSVSMHCRAATSPSQPEDDTLQALDQWLSAALGSTAPSITTRCRQAHPSRQQV